MVQTTGARVHLSLGSGGIHALVPLDATRMVRLAVEAMELVYREHLSSHVWVGLHAVEGQRLDGVRVGGVQIHVLSEAVGVDQERSLPPGGQARKAIGRKKQGELITVLGESERSWSTPTASE